MAEEKGGASCGCGTGGGFLGPVVKDRGLFRAIPAPVAMPDASIHYRVLFDAQAGAGSPHEASPAFTRVAKFLNMMAYAGVAPEAMEVAVIVRGGALPSVLRNAAFEAKFGCVNPSRPLVKDLARLGVKIYVCAQFLLDSGYALTDIAAEVFPSLSALVIIPEYQMKGWAVMTV